MQLLSFVDSHPKVFDRDLVANLLSCDANKRPVLIVRDALQRPESPNKGQVQRDFSSYPSDPNMLYFDELRSPHKNYTVDRPACSVLPPMSQNQRVGPEAEPCTVLANPPMQDKTLRDEVTTYVGEVTISCNQVDTCRSCALPNLSVLK